MTSIVTGVAGFVGSTLAARLLADGERVIGVDSVTDYYDPQLKHANLAPLLGKPGFTFLERDIADLVHADVAGARHIYHLAGQPGVRRSWGSEFDAYVQSNVTATQKLLELALGLSSLDRIVYASSSSIYGNAETFPTSELALPQPISPYGATKLAAEHLCAVYAANFGLPITSLRYFTVYGPRQRPDMAFTRFLRAAATGDRISIYGDGEQIRDFTFVDDVVEANLAAALAPVASGSVYNVAGGSSVSVNEVLDTIREISGRELLVDYLPPANGDVRRTGGDTTRIQSELEWAPKVSLEDGLARHWQWASAK